MKTTLSGALGTIDHNATMPKALTVAMIGGKYRVVTNRVENGRIVDEQPVDNLIFNGVGEAHKHLRDLKAAKAAVQS